MNPSPIDVTTASGRRALASAMAHAFVAALPDASFASMVCVVLDDRDRLARAVAEHLARTTGSPANAPAGMIEGRPMPRARLLELRGELGERLVRDLEAPVADGHVRVVLLAPRQRRVIDVAIDVRQVAGMQRALDDRQVLDNLGLSEHEVARAPARPYAVGSWRDPHRYLPAPLPIAWSIEAVDRMGVLTAMVEGRVVVEIGPMEPTDGRFLYVVMRKILGDRRPSDAEAESLLASIRSVDGAFDEITGMHAVFGDGRVFRAPVAV